MDDRPPASYRDDGRGGSDGVRTTVYGDPATE